jgi:hypothetical protein
MSEVQPTLTSGFAPTNCELDTLCRLIREEKVILWVGSGFSGYAGYPNGSELCSLLLSSLGELPEGGVVPDSVSLPEAADRYVQKNGREDLNRFLVEQFGKDPVHQDIHEALALINRIKYVVTTNYDPVFERAYRDRIVVVSHDEDLLKLSEYPDKTILLKIHGDVTDPDNLIITSEDYKKFDSKSIVWSKLRSLFAEKSVVFIGYSLQDSNVKKMLGDIYSRLKGKNHPYFFVSRKIDDKKRADFARYDLHFIEMDAISTIGYICVNALRFVYLDCMRNPWLIPKSSQLFESENYRLNGEFHNGTITNLSLVPTKPDVPQEFKITISSKIGENSPQFTAFTKFIKGESFEPVTLTDSECKISIRDGEMNRILMFDPEIQSYPMLSIRPQPGKIHRVDLQLKRSSIRIDNLKMKVFNSESLLKLVIEDPFLIIRLSLPKAQSSGTLNFSYRIVVPDIERGRLIFKILDAWIHGEPVELVVNELAKPISLSISEELKNSEASQQVHAVYQMYTDLSEIQKAFHIKFRIPEEISSRDYEIIRSLAEFIRGKDEKIENVSATVGIIEQMRDVVIKNEPGTFRMEGNDDKLVSIYHIFGKTLKVRYIFDGADVIVANPDEVRDKIERGEKDIPVVWKSVTGQLYKKFSQVLLEKAPGDSPLEEVA